MRNALAGLGWVRPRAVSSSSVMSRGSGDATEYIDKLRPAQDRSVSRSTPQPALGLATLEPALAAAAPLKVVRVLNGLRDIRNGQSGQAKKAQALTSA